MQLRAYYENKLLATMLLYFVIFHNLLEVNDFAVMH